MAKFLDIPGVPDLADLFGSFGRMGEEGIELVFQKIGELGITNIPGLLWISEQLPEAFFLLAASAASGALEMTGRPGWSPMAISAWNKGLSALVGLSRSMGKGKQNPKVLKAAFLRGVAETDTAIYPVADDMVHLAPKRPDGTFPMSSRRLRADRDRKAEAHRPKPVKGPKGAMVTPSSDPYVYVPDDEVNLLEAYERRIPWSPDDVRILEGPPTEPAKPAKFVNGLTGDEQDAFIELMDRASIERGKDWWRFQHAKTRDEFDRELMKRIVTRATRELAESGRVSDSTYRKFNVVIDGDTDLSLKEEVEFHSQALVRHVVHEFESDRGAQLGRSIVRVARPVIDEVGRVGRKAKTFFIIWLIFVLAAWAAIIVGSIIGNLQTVAIATFAVGPLCLVGTLIPAAVNWILNVARAFVRALSKKVNLPAEEAMAGFTHLLLDMVPFVVVFGFLTVAVIKIGGSSETGTARLVIWIAAAAIVARSAIYKRNKLEDLRKRDAVNTSQLLLKIVPVLLVGALGWTMWNEWNPTTVSTVAESGPFVVTSSVRWAAIWGIGLVVAISILAAKIKGDGGIAGIVRVLAGFGSVVCTISLIVVWINWEGEKPTLPVTSTTTTQTTSASTQAIPPMPPMPAPPTASRTVKATTKAPPAKAASTTARSTEDKTAAFCATNPASDAGKKKCAARAH